MIEHNTLRYVKFLKIIKRMKLHVLFFCCYPCVMRENMNEIYDENDDKNKIDSTTNDDIEGEEKRHDISYASNHGRIEIRKT